MRGFMAFGDFNTTSLLSFSEGQGLTALPTSNLFALSETEENEYINSKETKVTHLFCFLVSTLHLEFSSNVLNKGPYHYIQASHAQPEPNCVSAACLKSSNILLNEPKSLSISSMSFPDGCPPPFGLMDCQKKS